MKITYSKSEPYKSGWKGWADWVDVFVDGKKIGMLYSEGQNQRKFMEYTFTDELSRLDDKRSGIGHKIRVSEFGLKAAKAKLKSVLTELRVAS